ncbi:hypothetical protein ONZ45_g7681 [Pleurotus djamor]|nr:hypothetical protein ONZ45_g7681 [Pleurotus djamor]
MMTLTTLRDVLEILFDILEVMRYLYENRHFWHQDINERSSVRSWTAISTPPISVSTDRGDVCFIQNLLDSSKHPHETRTMLIDFDCAKFRDICGTRFERIVRTGTPEFASRAVQHNGPLPFKPVGNLPIPRAPQIYELKHKDRVDRFQPSASHGLPQQATLKPWKHDLEHDTESVFWVLFYWLMAAWPLGEKKESINRAAWTSFTDNYGARQNILFNLQPDAFHSAYSPAFSMIQDMAYVIASDRSWLSEQDPRDCPDYALEAFQRLMLRFILDKGVEAVLNKTVDTENPRRASTWTSVRMVP